MEDRPLEESDFVDRARQGDVSAYEALVQRYQEIAFRTAYVITRDAADAEDVVQEAFVKAYYALARFQAGAPFRPWLLRIVANEARNRRVASHRRASLTLHIAEESSAEESAPSPEVAALAAEQRMTLVKAMDALREEDRLVITYRYFLDLSEAEMAEALGCARGTVKSRLSRALGRLRHGLGLGSGTTRPEGEAVRKGDARG